MGMVCWGMSGGAWARSTLKEMHGFCVIVERGRVRFLVLTQAVCLRCMHRRSGLKLQPDAPAQIPALSGSLVRNLL